MAAVNQITTLGPLPWFAGFCLALTVVASPACSRRVDDRGKPGEVARPASAGAQSTEGESCAATRDCEAPLRCVAQTCWRPAGTLMAQYWEAAGEEAMARGDAAAATQKYERALTELSTASQPPSVRLICGQAHASLGLSRGSRDLAGLERAARGLHRCALAAGAGTGERWQALLELAKLEQQGLEPSLLARSELSEAYLTKAPSRPDASGLKLVLEPPPAASGKAFGRFVELMKLDNVRAAVTPCHEPYWTETQKTELAVAFNFKLKYHEADDPEDDRETMEIEAIASPGEAPALAKARACMQSSLTPLLGDFAKGQMGSRFSHPVTLKLSP